MFKPSEAHAIFLQGEYMNLHGMTNNQTLRQGSYLQ